MAAERWAVSGGRSRRRPPLFYISSVYIYILPNPFGVGEFDSVSFCVEFDGLFS